ncbi:MAG: tRNA (adenosine(37)-N6)-dimethylallyltransferase MiaA [Desulfobacteraceae bacterium]|nr:tRNA (adenosine(37)-N6)-dimethylallyltransferase MiaA [Desulfobacteraceae bacterium]
MKKKILVICGPTAIGKTGFAIKLANLFSGEIVGADSMQIYKKMDIGTAKPDIDEQKMAKHHLIDIVEPDENFDAGKYIQFADKAITSIYNKDKLPIVAGGTGLYIRALVHGLFQTRKSDANIISKLNKELEKFGNDYLYKKLTKIDPTLAKKLHPNDSFRVINALEVYESTGRVKSEQLKQHDFKEDRYSSLKFALHIPRDELYDRINKRVDIMMDQGFLNEVKELLKSGYSDNLKSMQSIGYKHICDYFNNVTDYDETMRLLKRDTRRFAKRQFTWFKKEKDIIWIKPSEIEKASQLIADFLN